jgi:hypothetical protein
LRITQRNWMCCWNAFSSAVSNELPLPKKTEAA